VRSWLSKIAKAERHFTPDFKRMRADMEFAAGYQWAGQEDLEESRYIADIVNQIVQKKTAALYAKNPTAVYERRPRLDFSIWDGDMASLQMATMNLMANPFDVEAQATLLDYQEGMRQQKMVEKVGETLEIAYQYQFDHQPISTTLRMKQLVRRVVTTGVGYVRLDVDFEGQDYLATQKENDVRKVKQATYLRRQLEEGNIDEDDAEVGEMEELEVGAGMNKQRGLRESLCFSYPQSTRIIVDPDCTALKGFVDADWVSQKYSLSLADVNAIFGLDIDATDLRPENLDDKVAPPPDHRFGSPDSSRSSRPGERAKP